jgi:hypothetical protein
MTLIELRKLAEAANTTTEQRANMQTAEYKAAWLARDAFKDAANPAAVISLLDQIQTLQAENERLNNLNQLAVSQSETLLKQRNALAAKLVPLTDEGMSHLAAITPRRSDETMHTYGVRVGRAVEAAHGIQAKGGQQ